MNHLGCVHDNLWNKNKTFIFRDIDGYICIIAIMNGDKAPFWPNCDHKNCSWTYVFIRDTMTVRYGLGFDNAAGVMKTIYRFLSTPVGIMVWAKQAPHFVVCRR